MQLQLLHAWTSIFISCVFPRQTERAFLCSDKRIETTYSNNEFDLSLRSFKMNSFNILVEVFKNGVDVCLQKRRLMVRNNVKSLRSFSLGPFLVTLFFMWRLENDVTPQVQLRFNMNIRKIWMLQSWIKFN